MRTAFAYSKNTVAAQLGYEVGFGTVASMARRFGITTPISTYPAMVLGTSNRPAAMASRTRRIRPR